IRALGLIRDPAAGPALERALRDPNKQIVAEAVSGIGLVGHTPARALLEQMFKTDRNSTIRNNALESLSLMRDPASTPLFESLLDSKEDSQRELAAEGLARSKYDAHGWSTRILQETKPNVRNALAFGLATSGEINYINDLA